MYKLINPDQIKQLANDLGDKQEVIQIIDMFLASYNDKMALIENAIKNKNFPGYTGLQGYVHDIKSNLYLFLDKETAFGAKIQVLEDKGRYSDETDLEHLFEYFKMNADKTIEELNQFLKEF